MLDIDNFSRINDTQGPAVGDVLLQEVANRLQYCLRDSERAAAVVDAPEPDIKDWVARTGGDEFAWRFRGVHGRQRPDRGAARATRPGEAVRLRRSRRCRCRRPSASASLPLDAAGAEALINNADAADASRQEGRAREAWNSSRNRSARAPPSGCRWRRILRKALERREFIAALSAALALKDLRVEAVEALCAGRIRSAASCRRTNSSRWRSRAGLIVEIGDWVLREACAQVRRWRDAEAPEWQVAVNVSGVQFRDGSLVRRVAERNRCGRHRCADDRARIHRRRLIEYSSAVSQAVKSLKELGVATALDDFGTGYSSMSYLRISRSTP